MDATIIAFRMPDMVQDGFHAVQTVLPDGITAGSFLQVGERLHVTAEVVEIVEVHAGTVVQGVFLVNLRSVVELAGQFENYNLTQLERLLVNQLIFPIAWF